MDCSRWNECLLYGNKLSTEQGIGAMYRKKYCLGNHALCARYRVYQEAGPEFVPDNLYPAMHDMALKIIADAKAGRARGISE